MFCRQSTVPSVWNSFPFLVWDLTMHPRTQIWFFNQFICTGACACSSNLNFAHKCIENSVNAYKCPNEPQKITITNTTLLFFYVETRKKFESNKRQWIPFRPKIWGVPYRNHQACIEKLWLARSIYPNLPQMGQKIYHGMLMPLHDSMPSFMNFRRVLYLLEFKTRYLNVCGRVTVHWCLKFILISSMGPKHAPKDTYLIFQQIYMHWSMCM